jgi:tRNA (guanine-N7-)-methyltransferase
MEEVQSFENTFDWHDYNSENPFPKGKWNSDIFMNDNPIVLELACGKGEYTTGLAQLHPNKNFIGFDIKGNRLWVGAQRALDKNLENVRFFRAYIDHLDQFFSKNEVSEIWIIFPDPQLKKDRKKLTSPKFLKLYKSLLQKGAKINLKTDSDELYEFTKEIIDTENLTVLRDIDNVYKDASNDPELIIKTYYEKKHLENKKLIKFISFQL